MARGNGLRRLKRAVAVAQHQAQRVGIFVGHQYVHVVAGVRGEMKVSGHDPRRAGPDRHRGRKVKSSVANTQKYRERSSREIRDDHILKTVIVQIGRRYVVRVYARGQERNLQIGGRPAADRAGLRAASQTRRVLRQGNRNAFADEECRRLSVFRAQQHFSPRTDRGQEIREIQCYVRKGIKKSRDSSPECQERRQRRGSENLVMIVAIEVVPSVSSRATFDGIEKTCAVCGPTMPKSRWWVLSISSTSISSTSSGAGRSRSSMMPAATAIACGAARMVIVRLLVSS